MCFSVWSTGKVEPELVTFSTTPVQTCTCYFLLCPANTIQIVSLCLIQSRRFGCHGFNDCYWYLPFLYILKSYEQLLFLFCSCLPEFICEKCSYRALSICDFVYMVCTVCTGHYKRAAGGRGHHSTTGSQHCCTVWAAAEATVMTHHTNGWESVSPQQGSNNTAYTNKKSLILS